MRVAMIYPSLRAVGGAENVVIWLAEGLVRKGHEIVLFTSEFSESVWGTKESRPYAVELLQHQKSRSTLRTNRAAGIALQKALAGYSFDIINPHNYPASLWVHYARQQTAGFPRTLLFLHNLTVNFYKPILEDHIRRLPGIRNAWERYRPKSLFRQVRQSVLGYRRLDQAAVRSADVVLANSGYAAELARRIYAREVQPCPLGVHVQQYAENGSADEFRHGPGADRSRAVVLTVARVERQKNLETLLRAIQILKQRIPEAAMAKFKIVGEGPYMSKIKRTCGRLELNDIVEFVGRIPHAQMGGLYQEAMFLVHLPLDEPFGLVPLEAALFNRPSIVSDHGGPAETVIDGVTGLHVNALDPADVAAKMEALLRNPSQSAKLGEAANDWVRNRFTWDIFLKAYEQQLVQLRERHGYGLFGHKTND